MTNNKETEDKSVLLDDLLYFIDGNERAMVFIDGANTFHAARSLGFNIDFNRLRKNLGSRCRVLDMRYFINTPKPVEDSSTSDSRSELAMRPLLDWLEYNGYTLYVRDYDPQENQMNNSLMIEMVANIIEASLNNKLDLVFIISGNNAFTKVTEILKQNGIIVVVISVAQQTSHNSVSVVSDKLRRSASHFIDWQNLVPHTQKENTGERRTSYQSSIRGNSHLVSNSTVEVD
jgi:uncharacterized LabA/DUF88 family protein